MKSLNRFYQIFKYRYQHEKNNFDGDSLRYFDLSFHSCSINHRISKFCSTSQPRSIRHFNIKCIRPTNALLFSTFEICQLFQLFRVEEIHKFLIYSKQFLSESFAFIFSFRVLWCSYLVTKYDQFFFSYFETFTAHNYDADSLRFFVITCVDC